MSENVNVEDLERELRVAQELLFLVLDHVGEPVVLDIQHSREAMRPDRMIDLSLNAEDNTWTLQVIEANG